MGEKVICSGFHWTFGWVRRTDLDHLHGKGHAYEEPNGDLVYSKSPRHRHGIYLDKIEDDTGGHRLVVSPIPKVIRPTPSRMRR
jgi:hypothetical protein